MADSDKKKAILEMARSRMSEAVQWDRQNREDAMDDLENLAGRQWPEEIRKERENDGKPCPTINQLTQFLRQVTGDVRQLNPSIKVIPGDDQTDRDSADLIEGIVRNIEYKSDASSVYERAAESAAACGIGSFRVLTEYESEMSFDQTIRIDSLHNALAVYWDPKARKSTREDADYCFITEMMKRDDFEKQYKGKGVEDIDHDGSTDGLEYWHEEGKVVVAEYIWKEPEKLTIGLLPDGRVIENPQPPENVIATRKTTRHKIKWAKISGTDVLEGPQDLPGKYIPVISVTGEEMHVGEEVVRTSVIRHAKDAQRMYNYASATQTEVYSLQPRAPYIVTAKQVAGLETFWNEANKANRPYLPYNPDEKSPPPQRSAPPISSTALAAEIQKSANDMRATTGIYDAALGEKSNEQSGVAIRQRQIESDVSTSIYTDNLKKAIEHCGRVVINLIPEIFDTQRQVRVISEDESDELVPVNVPFMEADGLEIIQGVQNDLTSGTYDVRVSVGPSYSTQRQEAVEGLTEFVRAVPQAAEIAGDLIARNLDWPGSEELADRLKSTLPPGMAKNEDPTPEEIQAQQQAQMQAQQQQQITQALAEAEIRKTVAEASEAESDAEKARLEAANQALEMAMQNGQMSAAIEQAVTAAVARALEVNPN